MRVAVSALAIASMATSLYAQTPTMHARPRPDSVETYLRHQMKKLRIPGLQVAVVQHGTITLLGAYGLANVEDSVPVTDRTAFPVHSITKAFVGVAIMQLVEAGKLDLAAPVSRYLDSLPAAWQPVTIRQLLTHTSGIPDIWDATARMISSNDDSAWAMVRAAPMLFAPGERFAYVQTNYLLLGKVIDKLSGEPFTRFIRERQLDVVGMPRTGFGDAHDVVPHIAGTYWYFRNVGETRRPTDTLQAYLRDWPSYLWTATGLNTTAGELARWIVALQQGRLISAQSRATLWTPGVLNDGSEHGFNALLNGYALGWPTAARPRHRAIGPTGGGRAAFFIYPDDDLTIVILTNLVGASPEFFIDEVAGHFIPEMRASNGFGLPPDVKALRAELMTRGFAYAVDVAKAMKAKDPAVQLRENDLNAWGYQLIEQGRKRDAIEIFKLNVNLYPDGWNTYDSLAEAYESIGDRQSAIGNYRRSLELNPKNEHGADRLKALGTK